jgi:hypothetical protein
MSAPRSTQRVPIGILVTAGLSSPLDHALVSLLELNGLRVSEGIGARPSHTDRVA